MSIVHKEFFDGAAQELHHVEDGRTVMCTGMLEEGEYNFDVEGPAMTILVTSGKLSVNGEQVNPGDEVNLDPEEDRVMTAESYATYIRYYNYG